MAVNKVVYAGQTLIDLTNSTVTPDTLVEGITALSATGESITGIVKVIHSWGDLANGGNIWGGTSSDTTNNNELGVGKLGEMKLQAITTPPSTVSNAAILNKMILNVAILNKETDGGD